jgi:hypothetical protein
MHLSSMRRDKAFDCGGDSLGQIPSIDVAVESAPGGDADC